jgi:hypothetical protein
MSECELTRHKISYRAKLSKFATEIGPAALAAFGYKNKAGFVKKKLYVLCSYP